MKFFFLSFLSFFVFASLYSQKARNTVCVIKDGRLMNVFIDSISPAGEKLVYSNKAWKKLDEVYPLHGQDYAGETTWFTKNEPLFFADTSFAKFEKEIMLHAGLEKVGTINGVAAYIDIVEPPADRLLYIPVRRGCIFQGYTEGLPPCSDSALITPQTREIKRGSVLQLTSARAGKMEKTDVVEYKWTVEGTDASGKSLIVGSDTQPSVKISTNLGRSILKDVLWIFVRITINKRCSIENQVRIKVVD